ncbi:MAG: glycosyltransferase family 87 protein [Gemmataceae bacterium]
MLLRTAITFVALWVTSSFALRESHAHGDDLVQDYVSARALRDGLSPYLPLDELRDRAGLPPRPGHVLVTHNPHPPGAILLTLPFAADEFGTALVRVRLMQLAALAAAWAVCFRLAAPPLPGWAWALVGGGFGLWAPVWQGLDWGQPVGVLALAAAGIWALGRAGRPLAFGLVLGLACTVRPFFALNCVVAMKWTRREQLTTFAGALVGGLVPFALVGTLPWEWYRTASAAGAYAAECGSLPGVLGLGTTAGVALYAAAGVVLASLRWKALAADSTLALAAVAAMMMYPLAWFQYDVSLIPVVAWVAVTAHRVNSRFALLALAVFVAARAVPDIIPDTGGWADVVGHVKGWVQVAARAVLLAAVIRCANALS